MMLYLTAGATYDKHSLLGSIYGTLFFEEYNQLLLKLSFHQLLLLPRPAAAVAEIGMPTVCCAACLPKRDDGHALYSLHRLSLYHSGNLHCRKMLQYSRFLLWQC